MKSNLINYPIIIYTIIVVTVIVILLLLLIRTKITKSKVQYNKKNKKKSKVLQKTQYLTEALNKLFSSANKENLLAEIEKILIRADIGITVTKNIIQEIKQKKIQNNITLSELKQIIKTQLHHKLENINHDMSELIQQKPLVIMIVGVNGVGKTTTVAKLTKWLQQQKKTVMLAACDTFRSAAVEQLEFWGNKLKCQVITPQGKTNDPAAVAFQATEKAVQKNLDVLLIDTAGRLHNKLDLMEQLKKIDRVIKKINPDYPQLNMLVLDATVGQNAKNQFKAFNETLGIKGIIMTKLDGTAKGGMLFSIATENQVPVYFIGNGEKDTDFRPFVIQDFVDSIIE